MSASNPYTQLAIGTCGHPVGTWPQVCDIGGGNPTVVCEECTRQQFALDGDETFIWVHLAPDKKAGISIPKKARATKPKKPKPLTAMQNLLQQEGLL